MEVDNVDRLHALTLADVLREHARSRPHADALVCGDHRHTYAQFDERVNRLATVLSGSGVGRGDRVLWLGQNCHRLLEGLLACAKLGAVFSPANWRQSPAEFTYVIDDAAPKVVLWQEDEIGDDLWEARKSAQTDARWIRHDGTGPDDYEGLLADASPTDPGADVDPGAPVLMLYTAAFEGRPRGALLSHAALLHQALAVALVQDIDPDYRYLNSGPLFHIATLMTTMATFHLGGRNVFTRRSDAKEMCRVIDEERINGAFLLHPTVNKMAEVLASGDYDLSSLVTMKMGVKEFDEAISSESSAWIKSPGGYGQTEVTGLATYATYGGHGFTSGRPSPVALVRIVDEDGDEVPQGETGEIVIRGPVVMNGYHGDAEETARRQRGGWHHTNDIGKREEDGTVTFVGPKTVLIKSGAENIYPAEVEGALNEHAAVQECVVIGVPDPEWGQNVRAVVVLQDGKDATEGELIEHCKERIASYKKPKSVVFADSLPRLESGFIDRDAVDAAHGGGGYPGA